MEDLYDRKVLLKSGWTKDEISKYFPILAGLSDEQLLRLHRLCKVHMFGPDEAIDREQALYVLLNPHDTPKELLFAGLTTLLNAHE